MRRRCVPWTEKQLATLRELYPHLVCKEVAARIGHPVGSTHVKAFALGIRKAVTFYTRRQALDALRAHGIAFEKGCTPANKLKHLAPELQSAIRLLWQLNGVIREKQSRGSARSPVRNARGAAG